MPQRSFRRKTPAAPQEAVLYEFNLHTEVAPLFIYKNLSERMDSIASHAQTLAEIAAHLPSPIERKLARELAEMIQRSAFVAVEEISFISKKALSKGVQP